MRSARWFLLPFLALTSLLSNAQVSWEMHSYRLSADLLQRADFNGDGAPDLMLYGRIREPLFVRNLGNGTFDDTLIHAQSDMVFDVQPGDFNRDGNIDFAGCLGNALEVIDGHGDGNFSLPRHFFLPCRSMAVADFNGDNKLDVAVVISTKFDSFFDNAVIVALGDGKGSFTEQIINSQVDFNSDFGDSCGFPDFNGMAVASDFNGDKKADLVMMMDCPTTSSRTGLLVVGLGDGTGHLGFHKDQEFHFDANTARLRIGDYNQDSKPDVIVAAREESDFTTLGEINVFQNQGNGSFTRLPIITTLTPNSAGGVADFDGNGIKDTVDVLPDPSGQTASVSFRLSGSQGNSQFFDVPVPYTDVLAADFDRDGRIDLALQYNDRLDIWLNRTAGAPTCPADSALGTIKLCAFFKQQWCLPSSGEYQRYAPDSGYADLRGWRVKIRVA